MQPLVWKEFAQTNTTFAQASKWTPERLAETLGGLKIPVMRFSGQSAPADRDLPEFEAGAATLMTFREFLDCSSKQRLCEYAALVMTFPGRYSLESATRVRCQTYAAQRQDPGVSSS